MLFHPMKIQLKILSILSKIISTYCDSLDGNHLSTFKSVDFPKSYPVFNYGVDFMV